MAQRVRITFRKEGALTYVSHLDLMRTWERAIRRARLPLAYTQGFSPHPRIAMAAPLPVGVTGQRELIDLWLDGRTAPEEVLRALRAAPTPGLEPVAAEEVSDKLPSLQSSLASAMYEVAFAPGALVLDEVRARISELLSLETLEWEEQRGEKVRRYDLRATILGLTVRRKPSEGAVLAMHLSLEEGRTGRPAQVLAALGVEAQPVEVSRMSVVLREERAALATGEGREPR
jgi:radical SAM-linked protein